MRLDAARKRALLRDGYAVLPRLVSPARVSAALREINRSLAGPAPQDLRREGPYHTYSDGSAPVMDLSRATRLAEAAASLLGPKLEPSGHAQVSLRFPAESSGLPQSDRAPAAHIDWLTDGRVGEGHRFALCAGVALSRVPEPWMGNLTVYPGTHAKISEAVKRGGLPALGHGIAAAIELPPPVQLTLSPGDAVLLHSATVHDASLNLSPHIRYMVYFRYYHADSLRPPAGDYQERAVADPWLEWPGMRRRREA